MLTPKEPFAALIFDCDGTLAETAPIHYECISLALARHGVELPRAWYFERIGLALRDLLKDFDADFGVRMDVSLIAADLPALYRARVANVEEIHLVAQIARQYKGRVPLAVASGGARELVVATLEAVGLASIFQEIVTIADVRHGKPEPDLFLEAARRLGVEPRLCVVYEDSAEGLEAARRAGMQGINIRIVHEPPWATDAG